MSYVNVLLEAVAIKEHEARPPHPSERKVKEFLMQAVFCYFFSKQQSHINADYNKNAQ